MNERVARVRERLRGSGWDALVCALPSNVLMMSGYWPVVGTGVATITSEGGLTLLVPEDEEHLARRSWAAEVRTFQPGSLEILQTASDAILDPLSRLLSGCRTIGYEAGAISEPQSYIAMHLYSGGMATLIESACAGGKLYGADEALDELKAVKTPEEIDAIRKSVRAAGTAFQHGADQVRAGATEVDVSNAFLAPLRAEGMKSEGGERSDGHVSCMSGARSGHAYGAFARSTAKHIEADDLVLTHCNSQVNGYWTDITRTFSTGEFNEKKRSMYEAVFEAREAALSSLKPGVAASTVDRAARQVMEAHGFGQQFRHSTGHGVGFSAIDALALPRLHPKSPDRIEPGMVFNVEPAIYLEDFGGVRQCEMVAMTESGPEILTRFLWSLEDLRT